MNVVIWQKSISNHPTYLPGYLLAAVLARPLSHTNDEQMGCSGVVLMTSKVYKLPLYHCCWFPKQEVKMCGQHVPSFLYGYNFHTAYCICIEIQMQSAKSNNLPPRYLLTYIYNQLRLSFCLWLCWSPHLNLEIKTSSKRPWRLKIHIR